MVDLQVVDREEEAIKLDGLSVAEMKNMRERAEKHAFQVKNLSQGNIYFIKKNLRVFKFNFCL
jgi:heat shock protein beta